MTGLSVVYIFTNRNINCLIIYAPYNIPHPSSKAEHIFVHVSAADKG